MAVTVANAVIAVGADLAQFNKGVDKGLVEAEKKSGTAGQRIAASFQKAWSGEQIGKGFVQGLGLAGGLGAVTLVSDAVSTLTNVLGEAVKGAIADEESQSRLKASLLANIPAWAGNTDAIEANITAKQRLGFEDETLRDSLAILVGATHDVTRAQEIQNIAMDLARYKGISLRDASEALIKVESGQYRSLKQLGIQLKEGATQQDALNAVQAVAKGQAEAYSKTLAGKLQAAQIAFNEALEDLGRTILPVVAEGLTLVVDGSKTLGEAWANINKPGDDLARVLNEISGASQHTAGTWDWLGSKTDGLGLILHNLFDYLTGKNRWQPFTDGAQVATDGTEKFYESAVQVTGDLASRYRTVDTKVSTSYSDIADAARSTAREVGIQAGKMMTWADRVVKRYADDAQAMIDKYFDPIEERNALHDTRLQLLADQDALRNAKTKEDRRQASDSIVQDLDDEAGHLVALGRQGALTQADVDKFTKDAKANYSSMGKEAKAKVDDLVASLEKLVGIPDHTFKYIINTQRLETGVGGHAAGGRGVLQFAAGGVIPPYQPAWVGEMGRELLAPAPIPRLVIPHGASEAIAGRGAGSLGVGGGDIHYHDDSTTILQSLQPIRTPADVWREMKMLSDERRLHRQPAGSW